MKIEVRAPQIEEEWKTYFSIRYEELRKPWNQPLGSEKTANEGECQHFALFVNNTMAGVLRMDVVDETTNQLRFMAISKQFQGQQLGQYLMKCAEDEAIKQGKKSLILHAREKAISFYERCGYSFFQKSYLLFDSIQHVEMHKALK